MGKGTGETGMRIQDLTRGRWKEILPHFMPKDLLDGKHHPCPKTGGTDRFRFSDAQGTGNYFCACSNGQCSGFSLVECQTGWQFPQIADKIEEILGEKGDKPVVERTWAENLRSEVIPSKRSLYLEGRGLEVPTILRWHKSLGYYIDGVEVGKYPAMLAPVMRGPKFLTYHVTYLHGGKKVAHDPARKILPGPSTVGASVPLYSAGPVLGVAEGIETAIAAKMLTGIPTWAALNAGNMAKWNCPPGVEHVVIFGDNDENYAGQAAAYTLAHRLKCSGLIVEIRFPEIVGDWNDVLLIARPQSAA
jgi:putative DNA primase/helicase